MYWAERNLPKILSENIKAPKIGKCFNKYNKKNTSKYVFMGYRGNITRMHRDSVDNLLCLYRGKKKVTLYNPNDEKFLYLYKNKNNYSKINIENIDYKKFEKICKAKQYVTELNPGEILYIPFEWYHHVKSYGSNIAVSFWYDE